MPNYWTSSGTLSCGDTYFMAVTCDPSVPYTGSSSCANKWTATANISCVNGLNISGTSTACQCDVPPVWVFDGDTNNCNCCTPSPSSTPTPTPSVNCQLSPPTIVESGCACFDDGVAGANDTLVSLNWSWSGLSSPNNQSCATGYMIQAVDHNGQLLDQVCIFNTLINSYNFSLTSLLGPRPDNIAASQECSNGYVKFRIKTISLNYCQESALDSAWSSFTEEYCWESCNEIIICDGFIDGALINNGIIVELQVEKNSECCCSIEYSLNNSNSWNPLPVSAIDCDTVNPGYSYSINSTCFGDIIP